MRFGGEMLQERGRESRFADACLARDKHDLAFPRFGPRPAPQQHLEFLLSPDESSQVGRVQRLETTLYGTCPKDRPDPGRPGDALEILRSEIPEFKEIAEQLSCAV